MRSTTMERETETAVHQRRPQMPDGKAEDVERAIPGNVIDAAEQNAADPEEVRRLAYRYWEQRGCPVGTPEEDWVRAEAELQDTRRTRQ